ncbi:MAG: hypothetical protein IJY39_05800 [Clostridia bacterium]|nr:hypothetical protein [Clostridia bacterium]
MNDVCFELFNLRLIPDACIESENSVKESLNGLGEVTCKLERELSSFNEVARRAAEALRAYISEVRSLLGAVDQKCSAAQGKKQQELPPPPKPSIPSDATPAQKNAIASAYRENVRATEEKNASIRRENQRIDEYCSRCNGAKQELERLISDLHQLQASLTSETEAVAAEAHEHYARARDTVNQSGRINVAMSEFYYAFDQILQTAQRLCEMNARSVRGYSYIDRLFTVKNTHSHLSSPVAFDFDAAPRRETEPEEAETDTELLIKTKDSEAFLEMAQGVTRIRMPSANLHKLGGKAFTAKMNALGFSTVAQADGSLIDLNGMIHWEKQ